MDTIINSFLIIGWLSVANAQNTFCSEGLCFFRPDPNSGATWSAAQQRCKENNATLPIADNPDHQKSFVEALSYFQLHEKDVWLGANAHNDGADNWHWLDGSQYVPAETVQQRGDYYKSYAYVADTSTGILPHASAPNNSYSYICQHNVSTTDDCTNFNGVGRTAFVKEGRCYTRLEEILPWFTARNRCLERNGDLASFSQLTSLDGIVNSSGFWVGLRHSHWDWRNSTSGLSSNVTYTSWRIGQPNDAAANCIATDPSDFPNWKDIDCTQSHSYICQASGTQIGSSSTISSSPSTSTSAISASSASAIASASTLKSLPGTPGTAVSSASSSTKSSTPTMNTTKQIDPVPLNASEKNTKSNDALAIGLGVGLGVLFLIIIVVIIVVIVVLRRKRRNSAGNGNAHSTKKFVTNNGQNGADNGMMEMTAKKKKKGHKGSDNLPAHYATVREVNPGSKFDPPSSQDVAYYADLQFASQGS